MRKNELENLEESKLTEYIAMMKTQLIRVERILNKTKTVKKRIYIYIYIYICFSKSPLFITAVLISSTFFDSFCFV